MTGREFQERRRRLGLSVEDLAALLDSSVQSIRNIEAGGQRPGRPLVRLLKLLAHPATFTRAVHLANQERPSIPNRLGIGPNTTEGK
jgi:transcriptional regulator with XRE-family HTH domain